LFLKVVDEEEKKKEEERKKVESEIAPDLEKIKSIADKKESIPFINFVYEKYPPKVPNFKKPDLKTGSSQADIKKAFKQALIYYHPDKNDGIKYGYPWHFIAVEISKYLGSFYEYLKG
jgi:hypothetical protein